MTLPPINPDDANINPSDGNAAVAEKYIASEVDAAKKQLYWSRLMGIVSTLAVLLYMGFLTANLSRLLRPHAAAEVVTGLVNERIQEQAQTLATQVKERVPLLIEQAPDYALKQLPTYRATLENQFETAMTAQCSTVAPKLEANMDTYLNEHKDKIKDGLAAGQDPAAVKSLADGLTQTFVVALKEKPASGESLQDKLDQSRVALAAIQKRMDRLANGKSLTADEKQMRRAIAIMTGKITQQIPHPIDIHAVANL